MYIIKKRFSDTVYLAGIICIFISLLFFCIPPTNANGGSFLINFIFTWGYFIYLLIEKNKRSVEAKLHHRFLFLILFFISCWALNRDMEIFEDPADWFTILLVILCVNYIGAAFLSLFPSWAIYAFSFINGVGLLTFLYLTIYLFPIYIVGIIGFFLLGLSLHVFVPVAFLINTITLQNRITKRNKKYWFGFSGGIIIGVTMIIIYMLQWSDMSKKIDAAFEDGIKNKSGLPYWTVAASHVPNSSFAKDVIKSDFVYNTTSNNERDIFWNTPHKSIGEQRKHDPLIMIATAFVPKIELGEDDRIKMLTSVFGTRHDETDRLWNGNNLYTDSVDTHVEIWPRCSMAYTEKTITVHNTAYWQNREEAIYTFYMSEGSVVTSLSLWINGKEEKGILTTKARADSTYRTIVGREKRDPSVVHWREGNTVSVRVFPVMGGEKRLFKIGITSPMARVDGKLLYENISFKGPSFTNAYENIRVNFEQPVDGCIVPSSFSSENTQVYNSKGSYNSSWNITMNDSGTGSCSYCFGGNEYSLAPYHEKLSPFVFKNIYLDINGSWSKKEFDNIMDHIQGKNVFVYDDTLIKIDKNNKDQIWEKLSQYTFSLFPLYAIDDTEHSLLITKNEAVPVELDDLRHSGFLDSTIKFLSSHNKIRLFNLGNKLPVYFSSFLELRTLQYDHGNAELLVSRLDNGLFPDDMEDDNQVVIHTSGLVIGKKPRIVESSGPDHIVRLFTYNHILQKLGKNLLFDRPVEDSLVKEAADANVVSPVSSLIVLESQADYDRFNIHDDKDGLQNAAMTSKGAAPEPHEWVLIALVVICLFYAVRKRKSLPSIS